MDAWKSIEKPCIRCGVAFARNHWNQRLCGSKASKSGCAHQVRLEMMRVHKADARRKDPEKFRGRDRKRRPAKGPFLKGCLSCGAQFRSKVVWGKYCGSRSEAGSCAFKAKKRAVKEWVSKNMPRILAMNKAWAVNNPEKAKLNHKNSRQRWAKTESGKAQVRNFSKKYKHQRRAAGIMNINAVHSLFKLDYQSKCACCLSEGDLTIDHKVPVSKGGTNEIKNLQPLCVPCNSRKGNKTIIYPLPSERMLSMLSL